MAGEIERGIDGDFWRVSGIFFQAAARDAGPLKFFSSAGQTERTLTPRSSTSLLRSSSAAAVVGRIATILASAVMCICPPRVRDIANRDVCQRLRTNAPTNAQRSSASGDTLSTARSESAQQLKKTQNKSTDRCFAMLPFLQNKTLLACAHLQPKNNAFRADYKLRM